MEIDVAVLDLECVQHVLAVIMRVHFLEVGIDLLAAKVMIMNLIQNLGTRLIGIQRAVVREELKRQRLAASPPQEWYKEISALLVERFQEIDHNKIIVNFTGLLAIDIGEQQLSGHF